MVETHEGGCVCRSLRYRVNGEPARVNVCHCTWCQRRTGSGFAVVSVFPAVHVQMLRAQPKTYRHHSDESGRWLDHHFCTTCGTNVGFTAEWVPGIFAVESGTFDDASWLRREKYNFRYIYLRSARDWSAPPAGAECYEKHFRV